MLKCYTRAKAAPACAHCLSAITTPKQSFLHDVGPRSLTRQIQELREEMRARSGLSEFAVFQTSPSEEDRLDLEATALRSATNYCPHCGIKNAHGAAAKTCHDCGARFAKPLNLAA